jgi:hypothetical protein
MCIFSVVPSTFVLLKNSSGCRKNDIGEAAKIDMFYNINTNQVKTMKDYTCVRERKKTRERKH